MRYLSWLASILLAIPAFAQEPAQEPVTTLKLATSIVGVSAVVLDSSGEPVKGLTKDDFTLKQDGKPQEIRYFSEDPALPLTLALLVDTSGSQTMFLEDEIMASEKFFRAMLTRPTDRAALLQFDTTVLERQAMTPNVQTLENSLNFLSMPHHSPATARGGTLLYDAICAATSSFTGNTRGRRAMAILTDGEDNGSRATLAQAIMAAQRADIVVYGVVYSSDTFRSGMARNTTPPGQVSGTAVLEELSKATGGRVFTVTKSAQLSGIYGAIADDLRLQYQIGYTPPESKPGAYHKIELRSKLQHMTVEARQGYYSPK